MNSSRLSHEDYLKRPYARQIIPDKESGTYTAKIEEFPGCVTQGDTEKEAYENLEAVAKSWILAALDLGQEIPPPNIEHEFSGKFALRLPKSLHRQASLAAEREGTSLNQFITYAVSEKVGALNLYADIVQRIMATLELQQRKFQTAVTEAFRHVEYAIQKQADTSPTQIMIDSIVGLQTNDRRMN
jgi:antitoxin HicB